MHISSSKKLIPFNSNTGVKTGRPIQSQKIVAASSEAKHGLPGTPSEFSNEAASQILETQRKMAEEFAKESGIPLKQAANQIENSNTKMSLFSTPFPKAGQDLSGLDLREHDLRGADLRGCKFKGGRELFGLLEKGFPRLPTDLSGVNFAGCDLTGANLSAHNLTGANLSGCNVENTRFPSRLEDVNLSGCINLQKGQLPRELAGVNLSECNLAGWHMMDFNLRDANLTNANLTETSFRNANLSGANLTNANLREVSFRFANLTNANLTNSSLELAHLEGANLTRANLTDVDLNGVDLSNANLTEAVLPQPQAATSEQTPVDLREQDLRGGSKLQDDLKNANLSGANLSGRQDLRGLDLSGANLSGANLTSANLSGADLSSKANLTKANLTEANLTEASLESSYLYETKLPGANLTSANLRRASVANTDLSGANLTGANLTTSDFSSVNLSGANLSGAIFSGAFLAHCNLMGANLTGANFTDTRKLSNCNLSGANLAGADLSGADLTRSNLSGANLTDANLTGANLGRADLSGADFTNVIGLSTANFNEAVVSQEALQQIRAERQLNNPPRPLSFVEYAGAAQEAFPSLEQYPELKVTTNGIILDERSGILLAVTEVPAGEEFNLVYKLTCPADKVGLPENSRLTVSDLSYPEGNSLTVQAQNDDRDIQLRFSGEPKELYSITIEVPGEDGGEPRIINLSQETGKVFPFLQSLFQSRERPPLNSADLALINEITGKSPPAEYAADLISSRPEDWWKVLAPNVSLEELENTLKPGGASSRGFLGSDGSLEEIMTRDNQVVKNLYGLTHADLALPLLKAVKAAQNSVTGTFEHNGEQYQVESFGWVGSQVSPFDGLIYPGANKDLTVTRLSDSTNFQFPGLEATLALEGFYQDTQSRTPPEAIAEFFGLNEISEDQPNQSVQSNERQKERERQARSSLNEQQIMQARRLGLPDTASEQQIIPQPDSGGGIGTEAIIEEPRGEANPKDQVTEAEHLGRTDSVREDNNSNASITESVNSEINQAEGLPVDSANKSRNFLPELELLAKRNYNLVSQLPFKDETVIPPTDSRVSTGDKKVVTDSTPDDGISDGVSQPVVQIPVQISSKQVEKVLVQ